MLSALLPHGTTSWPVFQEQIPPDLTDLYHGTVPCSHILGEWMVLLGQRLIIVSDLLRFVEGIGEDLLELLFTKTELSKESGRDSHP